MQVVPLDDIAIVWQAHMAKAKNYTAFCLEMFGKIIDMRLKVKNPQKSMEYTTSLWKDKFKEDYKIKKKKDNVITGLWKWLFDPESDIDPSKPLPQFNEPTETSVSSLFNGVGNISLM